MSLKEATKEECLALVRAYPRKLEKDFGPFGFSWNDFTLGSWPDSVVACCDDRGETFKIREDL